MKKKSLWKSRKIVGGLLGPFVLLAVLPAPANAYPRPGATERVSVASDGAEGNNSSYSFPPAISPDGRHVAFVSAASNLVPGDTNGVSDAFVHDLATGTTERVSVASDGAEGNSYSFEPVISPDGRYVAFPSIASNLLSGDTNLTSDVFVRDRATGTTERVSVASDGAQTDGSSVLPAISADGRYVAFSSFAANLAPGDTNIGGVFGLDVFVHDRATGTTERVSVASDGAQGNGLANSYVTAMSPDGRYVAFHSNASNLVPGDTNGDYDVFVHDRATGTTERVSVASDGAQANSFSDGPAISADGRHVAFRSDASNLVPADTNGRADVFVHDRATGTTERVSVASDGAQADPSSYDPAINPDGSSVVPAISADGRYVAFMSDASNLVFSDTNGSHDVFVHDRARGTTERVSVASNGAQGDADSFFPAISADGQHVAFVSDASNLVPADTNGRADVFVHDRGSPLGMVGTLSVLKNPGGVGVYGRATFSGATLAGATDPDDDATGVESVGAELTEAALIYRPEQEDLLLRLDLASLPPAVGGLPGVLYGVGFQSGGTTYEVRALRAAATAVSPAAPYAALYRCTPDCIEHAPLTGSFGTTGEQVLVSVPLSALGATEGTELTGLRAFTAAGEAAPGGLVPLDEAPLSSSVIPASRVELGITPASTPEDQVAFAVEADLLAGDFSGTIPTAELSPGSYRVWARACLGDVCGPAAFEEVAL